MLSLVGAGIKLVILPVVGFFCLNLFHVPGIPFKVGMIFFTLPTSASIYVLSSQLNSDTELASATIVTSTILSFFSLSIGLLL
jgi:predicted permease